MVILSWCSTLWITLQMYSEIWDLASILRKKLRLQLISDNNLIYVA